MRTTLTRFMGIMRLSEPDQIDRQRSHTRAGRFSGNLPPKTCTGSDELESDSNLLDDLKQGLALRGQAGIIRADGRESNSEEDIKGFYSRLDGYLDLGAAEVDQITTPPELAGR